MKISWKDIALSFVLAGISAFIALFLCHVLVHLVGEVIFQPELEAARAVHEQCLADPPCLLGCCYPNPEDEFRTYVILPALFPLMFITGLTIGILTYLKRNRQSSYIEIAIATFIMLLIPFLSIVIVSIMGLLNYHRPVAPFLPAYALGLVVVILLSMLGPAWKYALERWYFKKVSEKLKESKK